MKSLKHISMNDVAATAGVSKSTVSKALNNKPEISAEQKKKIFTVCENLGYKVNFRIQDFIRERKNGMTRNVAFVLVGKNFGDPAYAHAIDGIAKGASENNLHLMLETLSGNEKTHYDLPPMLRDGRVDGIILTGELTPGVMAALNKIEMPCVILGTYPDAIVSGCISVKTEESSLMESFVEAFLKHGKKRIAYFSEDPALFSEKRYLNAYKNALREKDIPVNNEIIYFGKGPFSGAYDIFKEIFRRGEIPFDSIICLDYRTAQEISHLILVHSGLDKEPEILMGVGRYYKLPIPAIYYSSLFSEIAYTGIKSLVELINSGDRRQTKKIVLNHPLVVEN